ncbi:MAG TPA: hypothetical protein VHC40_04740 [Rhizomicrobium sp.]|nr:hypothetical protein [Rhizomicrobium sp.]
MKKLAAAIFAFTVLGAGVADVASAQPRHHRHRVCVWRHHHRICHWR